MDNRIKTERAIRKMTQKELADALNVSRQTIIAIESNKRDPSLKLAFDISKFFGKNIEEVFSE